MVYDGALNTRVFLKFLPRLVRGAKRSIPHRRQSACPPPRIVVAWVKANEEKIELIFLPAYAPERNPDSS